MIFVWIAIGVATASYVMAVQAQKKAQKQADDMKGVLFNKESNIEPIPVVYGKRRVGGVRVYVATQDADTGDDIPNEFLYIALVLCEGDVNSITDIEIDGNPITDNKYSGLYTINIFTGANGQGSSSLLAQSSSDWTTDARLRGVAYLAIKLKWNEDAFQAIPTITALVEGKKIYDPRQNSQSPVYDASVGVSTQRPTNRSTWLYSDNPALCIRDYLTDTTYGKGLPESAIDYASFAAAADDCEELFIPFLNGFQRKLFRTHAVLQTNQTIFENIEQLLMGCRGFLPFNQGQYSLVIDKNRSSTFSFNLDNMTSGLQIKGTSKDSKYNQVTVKFANEAIGYEPDEITYPSATGTNAEQAARTAYLAEDNGTELSLDVDLETVTNVYVARDLAQVFLRRSRAGMTVNFKATSEALNCSIGDTVAVTHPSISPTLVPKLFQVNQLSFNYDGEVTVQLVEFESSAYTYDTMNEIADFLQPNLPDPFTVAVPTNLIGSSTSFIGSDGTVIPVITVTWTGAADSFVNSYIVEWKKASESVDAYRSATTQTTTFELTDIVVGNSYNVNVYSVNALGVRSAPISLTTAGIGDTTAPAAAASLTATPQISSVVLTWTNPSDADFSHMTVRQKQSGGSWTTAASVSGGKNEFETFTVGNVVGGTTYYYAIRSVDYSGNVSAYVYSSAVVPLSPETRAPRNSHDYVYFKTASANQPSLPTATSYDFDDNVLGGLTSTWQQEPLTVTGGDGKYWAAAFVVTENAYDGTETIAFSAPFSSYNFDGLVTFTNLNNALSQGSTTIDGGLIKTGTVAASRLAIDGVGLDTQLIGGVQTLVIGGGGVTNANIATNTITASRIAANAINNSEINTGAVQTYNLVDSVITPVKIEDLAVTEGKIANLAVDTIKIKNQAVTIPSSVEQSSDVFLTGTSEYDILSLTWASTGAVTEVLWGVTAIISFNQTQNIALNIKLNGTLMQAWGVSETDRLINFINVNPNSGNNTLKITARANFGYSGSLRPIIFASAIRTLELKK